MHLTERVTNVLLQPAREWPVIDKEPSTPGDLYKSYIMPLAAIGPLASIFRLAVVGVVGVYVPLVGTYTVPLRSAVGHAVVSYVLGLVAVYVLALVIDSLAPTFQGIKSNIQALKVAAYSSTAAWLCGILNLLPSISFLQILSLYSLYLLFLGLPVLMNAPQEKAFVYTVVVVIAAVVIFAVIGAIGSLFVSYPAPTMPPRAP
jgi:hypothetical protein